jgi:ubiquinone/menaquinone biosynthesis C-methylase UbiE
MSFPEHDPYWGDTVKFIRSHYHEGDFVLAPDIFWEKFNHIYTYKITQSQSKLPDNCYWVVLHKGILTEIGEIFLQSILRELTPVFANEVFVIFTRFSDLPVLPEDEQQHLIALQDWLRDKKRWSNWFKRLGDRLRDHFFSSQSPLQRKTGLPEKMEKIVNFITLSDDEVRQEMNRLYLEGGYEYPTLYDQTRSIEIDQFTLEMIPATANKNILDIGCGVGRGASIIQDCMQMVGIDLSDVAIEQSKKLYGDRGNCRFLQMNALHLDFPDNAFDIVLMIEVIEHVSDAQRLIHEAIRVLKSGGCLLLNAANRDSLHLRVIRSLGYQEFKTNYQHIQEFYLSELQNMLVNTGAVIQEVKGSFLIPYWGVPGVDASIRALTDHKPEVIEALKELGHQVAPEYTYTFFIACTKP